MADSMAKRLEISSIYAARRYEVQIGCSLFILDELPLGELLDSGMNWKSEATVKDIVHEHVQWTLLLIPGSRRHEGEECSRQLQVPVPLTEIPLG